MSFANARDKAKGVAYPAIGEKDFFNGIIALPPIEEQQRIVAKIEELLPYVDRYATAYEKLEQFNAKFPEDMKKSILQYAIQGKLVEQRPEEETTATQIPPELYADMGSALWEQERTTLIKKECHKYDEEWRMITGCIMKPPVMMEWIPSGIILGLRMDVAEENLVVSMAKEAGIKNIYKSYINAQNKLDAYLLKV